MPRIDEILDQLGGARHFSTLDLASGYWQVPLGLERGGQGEGGLLRWSRPL